MFAPGLHLLIPSYPLGEWRRMVIRTCLTITLISAGALFAQPLSDDDIVRLADPDRSLLERSKIDLKTESLIAVLAEASKPEVKWKEIVAETAKLGSAKFAEREQAAKRLN